MQKKGILVCTMSKPQNIHPWEKRYIATIETLYYLYNCYYCMSMKSGSISCSKLLYKMGQDFLDRYTVHILYLKAAMKNEDIYAFYGRDISFYNN